MTFNPDLSKPAQEVIFSRKTVKISHPSLTFNVVAVAHTMRIFQKQIRGLES